MLQVNKEELVNLILQMAEDIFTAKDQLTELDAAIGDGDLGVTMTLGFRAIQLELKNVDGLDLNGILSKCGTAFADNAASTFGALMSTMFLRSARSIRGKDAIGTAEAAGMLAASVEGVQQRGKAEAGDKTVLDAMIPASKALQDAADNGSNLPDGMRLALQAAQQGAENTIGMKSKAGRSGWLGDRTIGVKDPGAAAFVLLLDSICRYLTNH
jgi:phosphoenolpyruvate---glycerone phosphotransferase subunit DhaL